MSTPTPHAPVRKREIFGWAMYDFANSSYTTVVVSFIYSAFFISYIVPPELDHLKNTFWAASVAMTPDADSAVLCRVRKPTSSAPFLRAARAWASLCGVTKNLLSG